MYIYGVSVDWLASRNYSTEMPMFKVIKKQSVNHRALTIFFFFIWSIAIIFGHHCQQVDFSDLLKRQLTIRQTGRQPSASQYAAFSPQSNFPQGIDKRGRSVLYQGGRMVCNNFNDRFQWWLQCFYLSLPPHLFFLQQSPRQVQLPP